MTSSGGMLSLFLPPDLIGFKLKASFAAKQFHKIQDPYP
ncbi:hypothetical protein LINGRAHAP2_LOCUS21978 [Linum grandiflorum]